MKRSAVTFAEIFVVLSLAFLVQTVLSFSLLADPAETEYRRLMVVRFSQVPAADPNMDEADRLTDHIRYVAVGDDILLLQPGGCIGSTTTDPPKKAVNALSPATISSRYEGTPPRCVSTDRIAGTEYRGWDGEGQISLFREIVAQRYKARVVIASSPKLQTSFSLAFDPHLLEGKPTLRVGFCACYVETKADTIAASPRYDRILWILADVKRAAYPFL